MVSKKLEKELLFDIVLFGVGILFIVLFYQNNILLTALLLVAWLFALKFWHKKHDAYFFIVGAIVGPIGEIIAIYFGVWQYANPSFLGIPMWLPFVWGLAIVLIKRIAEIFVKIEFK